MTHVIRRIVKKVPPLYCLYKAVRYLLNYLIFIKEFQSFKRANDTKRFSVKWKNRYVCLNDKTATTSFDRHYVFHTAWAARILAHTLPKEHVDISSLLYFATLTSAFVPIRFYEYRPVELNFSGLQCEAANLLALPFPDMSVESLSCMHVVEHVGLGRYGDPMDCDGDLKTIRELKRVLASGGQLLFVVPIGRPKIMFNAHRIYSYSQIMSYFEELELVEFALISDKPENGGLIQQATEEMADAQTYGCGCFWFRKEGK